MEDYVLTLGILRKVLRETKDGFADMDRSQLQELCVSVNYLIADLRLAVFWIEIAMLALEEEKEVERELIS